MSAPPPAAVEPGTAQAAPVAAEEFARRLEALGPFERPPRLAVAVSGGADSLALALLAAAWARARGGTLRAFHVDHRLRRESAGEAARLAGWLAARGIACRILPWSGPRPASRVQESARAARLALLEEACAAEGILHLLLAHHAQDQGETVAMRAARRSGPAGLAGMPAVRETGRLRLLRPFLDLPKARLVATLAALGQPWIDDPSNRDPRFERGRLRAAGAELVAPPAAIAAFGARRAALERAIAELAARIARPDPRARQILLDAAGLAAAPREVAAALLRRAVATVGGGRYPPAPAAVERLLGTLLAAESNRGSLGGCLLTRMAGVVRIEPERRPGRPPPGHAGPALADAAFGVMLLEGGGRLCKIGEAVSGHARFARVAPDSTAPADRCPRRPTGEGPIR